MQWSLGYSAWRATWRKRQRRGRPAAQGVAAAEHEPRRQHFAEETKRLLEYTNGNPIAAQRSRGDMTDVLACRVAVREQDAGTVHAPVRIEQKARPKRSGRLR